MAAYLDENGLLYFWTKLKALFAGKVDTEAGKGLSTEDYTTTEKTKLAGIATGANKTTVTNSLTSTSTSAALAAAQGKVLDGKITDLSTDLSTNYAKKTDIAGGVRYKGSVATYADLPSGADAGDMYDVIADGHNYVWNGTAWDDLGGTFRIEAITNAQIDTVVAS